MNDQKQRRKAYHAMTKAELIDVLLSKDGDNSAANTGERNRSLERALRSEARLSSAIEHMTEGFVLYDSSQRLLLCNQKYRGFYGYSEEDAAPGTTFEDLVRLDVERGTVVDDGLHEKDRVAFRKNPDKGLELQLTDGRWLLIHENTSEEGTVGIVTDITERKRAEEALSDSEARYRQAVELTAVGHWVWDEVNNKCIFCSEEMARIHGVSVEEYLASASSLEGNINWAHPDDRERLAHVFVESARQETNFDVEYKINTRTGEVRHVRELGKAVFDENGAYIRSNGVLQDITDQKQSQESLQTALADAEQANRAKSEFLATMSHEFRTPLNAILGFSDMLRAQYFGPLGAKKYKEYAHDIHDSGTHMLALVDDMLDIAAIEAGKRTIDKAVIDADEVLKGCINDMELAAQIAGIDLSLDVPDDLPSLYADRRSTVQIVLNLLSNAIKFTERDGTVSVSVKSLDDQLTIGVSDTGIGIEPERLSKITEPFSQAHDEPHITQNGTGLGLSIVKSLVEMHQGNLNIESEIDKGTIVTVAFPIQSGETE